MVQLGGLFVLIIFSISAKVPSGELLSKLRPPPPPLIPRNILVGDKDVYDVQISPDGRLVAFLHAHNFQLNIWLWDRVQYRDPPKPITNESRRSIIKFQWLFDNRTIVYSQDSAGEENYRLFAIDALKPDQDRRLLTPEKDVRSILFYVSATHPHKIAIASNERDQSYFDIYTLDLISNKKEMILINDKQFKTYHMDDDFRIHVAAVETDLGGMDYYRLFPKQSMTLIKSVSPEERLHTRLITIDFTGQIFYWMDSSEHDLGIFVAENRSSDQSSIDRLPNSQISNTQSSIGRLSINWLSNRLSIDQLSINRTPTDQPSITKKVLHKSILSEIDFDHTFFDPLTNEPLIVYEDYKRLTPIVLDSDRNPKNRLIKKHFDHLQRLLPPDFVPVLESTDIHMQVWVIRAVSSRRPAEYVIYTPNNRSHPLVYLFNEKFGLLLYPLADTETIDIPIKDNLTQICYLTKPLNAVGPLPMVLLVHGGPWMRIGWGFDTTTQTMANRGYLVLQCNFRGSTGFGKKFFNAGNGEWSDRMQDDLLTAAQWAIDNRLVDKNRMAIAGSSYGGYAVLTALTRSPDFFKCGIDVFGPSNLTTLFQGIPQYWKSELNSLKRRIGADPDTEEGQVKLRKWSPLTYAHKIKKPLLVVHGANDPRVRQIESDSIVKAARANRVDVTYVVFPDEGHSVQQAWNGLALTAMAEQFLEKCLGGRAEPVGEAFRKTSAIITRE